MVHSEICLLCWPCLLNAPCTVISPHVAYGVFTWQPTAEQEFSVLHKMLFLQHNVALLLLQVAI